MKKFLLVLGVVAVAMAGSSNVLATDVEPVVTLGNSFLTGNYPVDVFTPIITPAANTNGVHIKTIAAPLAANTSIAFLAKTTTPTTAAMGRAFSFAFAQYDSYNLLSTVEYFIPAGMGVWAYPDGPAGSVLFFSISWDVN